MNKDTQLCITKTVLHPKGGDAVLVEIDVSSLGLAVHVGNFDTDKLSWDQLEDVEYLADFFWALPVWQFRAVVELLSQTLKARALSEELV